MFRKLVLIISFLILTSCVPLDLENVDTQHVFGLVERLDFEVQAVSLNEKDYEACEVILHGITTEGVSIVSYYDSLSLRKLSISYLGEMGKREDMIYFSEGEVIFVESLESFYNKPMYVEDSEVVSSIINKYYFDGKQFYWFLNDNESFVDLTSSEYESKSVQFQKEFELLDIENLTNKSHCSNQKEQ